VVQYIIAAFLLVFLLTDKAQGQKAMVEVFPLKKGRK
jgi:hypothetical protein